MSTIVAALALLGSLIAVTYLVFADTYTSRTCITTAEGVVECTSSSRTLIEENGSWVLLLLAIPVLLTAAGLLATYPQADVPWLAAWVVAVLYALLCIFAIAPFGLFFVPSAFLLLVATAWDGYRRSHHS